MIVFGYGMRQDIENIALAVLDEDGTSAEEPGFARFTESATSHVGRPLRSQQETD